MPADLYERDFYEWTQRNAELLRSGRIADADAMHLAEEIGDMGKQERRALLSRAAALWAHLLKWQTQPERFAQLGSDDSCPTARDGKTVSRHAEPQTDFAGEGSCRRLLAARRPRKLHRSLSEENFPSVPPFGLDQLLSEDFLP